MALLRAMQSVGSRHVTSEGRSIWGALAVLPQGNHTLQQVHDDMPQQMENPYKEPPKKCILCGVTVDYKNTQLLSQFISPHTGRIYGRHITGLCGRKQRAVSKAIKRAHIMGFMPITYKDPAFLQDPKICEP
ncbi:28S ribosomal protein S18c, mitochondrial [Xenopus laevis]|uniref:Small ribosomal subunit protein bS18m n=2 Tax=Xenopus laevis TaxID=8355 RepID=A0A310U8N3_XENLA|nr:28S ribosomal protein S18c, mitochondrial [Xenopus laevis]OCT56446.1 hypothetical protein XELAEV_18000092mg [Xenopus laevis]